MKKLLCLAALTLVATTGFAQGMPRDSVVLGERTVDFRADHDVIPVEGRALITARSCSCLEA